VDRRTAGPNQANAFREEALADPAHHDEWIDKAIRWLERAKEASCRIAISVEVRDGIPVAEPACEAAPLPLQPPPQDT
jgi:hypothetical protein